MKNIFLSAIGIVYSLVKKSFGSRVTLLVLSSLLSIAMLEIAATAVQQHYFGNTSSAEARARLSTALNLQEIVAPPKEDAFPFSVQRTLLHPYFGFVFQGGNSYGFPGPEPFTTKAQDEVIVAITGGSVALHFAMFQLHNTLLRDAFPNKKVKFFALAIPGYKQPQQLMTFSYMLMRGVKIDVIINLDGFNEVALPHSENLPKQVHPSYPRHWYFHSQKALDQNSVLQAGRILHKKEQQHNARQMLRKGILSRSAFFSTVAQVLDNRYQTEINRMESDFGNSIATLQKPDKLLGPSFSYESKQEKWNDIIGVWKNSSLQMHKLAQANGISYLHLLQPNQWHKDSKPFSQEELALWADKYPAGYRTAVEESYSLLIKEGKDLDKLGVPFADLTMAFADEKRTLYYDSCCHFNELGHEIVAKRVVSMIERYYRKSRRKNQSNEINHKN